MSHFITVAIIAACHIGILVCLVLVVRRYLRPHSPNRLAKLASDFEDLQQSRGEVRRELESLRENVASHKSA